MTKRMKPVPWTHAGGDRYHTDRDLRSLARQLARDNGGRLLDWRIILRERHVILQARYLLEDGIARHAEVAL